MTIGPYRPMQAGSQILSVHPEAGSLGTWTSFGVFCLYASLHSLLGSSSSPDAMRSQTRWLNGKNDTIRIEATL